MCCSVLQCVAVFDNGRAIPCALSGSMNILCAKQICMMSTARVLQCVAVCCSMLQCVALFDNGRANIMCFLWEYEDLVPNIDMHDVNCTCVAVCCSVLQCVAVCCSVLQSVAECCSVLQCAAVCCNLLQYVLIYTRCVAVCCSAL